jgi:hypothetical protein
MNKQLNRKHSLREKPANAEITEDRFAAEITIARRVLKVM